MVLNMAPLPKPVPEDLEPSTISSFDARALNSGSSLLMMQSVTVSFDGFKALNDLSFSIAEGELRAIIGPNGAGKTTFMDVVTGKTRPDQGRVVFGSTDVLRKSEAEIARLGVGRKFQRPTVFEHQTVFENLMMALANRRDPISGIFYTLTRADRHRVFAVAEQIHLADELQSDAGILSHGQKQWLEIGMLLAQEPKLLLVDEPAAGMTPAERERTVNILREVSKTRSVVVIEHDMEFVRNLDCRVTVLHEGSVLAEGFIDHVVNNEEVIDVYLGR
jgi:urea transport system ATP-binding protein